MPSSPDKKRPKKSSNPDHRRSTHVPAPHDAEIERRLESFVKPAIYAEAQYYRQLGMRNRILTLPVMMALILGMIWRRIPGVCELQRTMARERILWVQPQRVSQSSLSDRFLEFPAELIERVLYRVLETLPAREQARTRPLPPILGEVRSRFAGMYAVDATTLEPLFRKVGSLQDKKGQPVTLGGHVSAAVDLHTHLPCRLWWSSNPHTNEKAMTDDILAWLPRNSLMVFDLGYFSYALFDAITAQGSWFVTRMRNQASYQVTKVLLNRRHVRDQIVQLGVHQTSCQHPMRLIEVCINGTWHRYLTNVLDPKRLSIVEVVEVYDARWKIETSFLLVKRLLDLSYLWVGSQNGVWLQVLATFLFYSVLIDLCDDVADELGVRLEQISVEMVYRGLYHYSVAVAQGDWDGSAPAYFAQDPKGLGIIKRERPRDGPTTIEIIRRAILEFPLPEAELDT